MRYSITFIFTVFWTVYTFSLPLNSDELRYVWIQDSKGVWHFEDLLDDSLPSHKFNPDEDIVYLLYTRENPTEGQIIQKGDVASLLTSNFDVTKQVKFTIHGWTGDADSGVNTKIRKAMLNVLDVNVITVDWAVGADVGYLQAARNVAPAAQSVAEFVDWLNSAVGVSFKDIHLIGHSLGGQLVGIAGRRCTRGQIEYISSLDPAHPTWGPTSERIRKTDGKYVELMHTNTAMLGMLDAVGHNDFYPNGGKNMPGCDGDISCSHIIAEDYMAESIESGGFTSVECITVAEALLGPSKCTGTKKIHFGGTSIKPEMGIFALETNAEQPYSKG